MKTTSDRSGSRSGDRSGSRAAENRILMAVLVLLFVQLGLFMAGWDDALGREYGRAIPFFIISAACFAANLVLLNRLRALDTNGND